MGCYVLILLMTSTFLGVQALNVSTTPALAEGKDSAVSLDYENFHRLQFEKIVSGFKQQNQPQYSVVKTTDLIVRDVLSRINVTSIDRINGSDRVLTPVYILTQNGLKGQPEWRVFHYVWRENPQHYDIEAILGVMPTADDRYRVEVGKFTSRGIKVTVDGNQSGTIPFDNPLGKVSPGHILFYIAR